MRRDPRSAHVIALGVTVLMLALPAQAPAHETKLIGAGRLTIGWAEEPALSGLKNAIEVDVVDTRGAPLADPHASLAVEVSFGSERIKLPMAAAAQHPGRFRAAIVPTRPGTYTFRVTGTIKGQSVDAAFTCSETTFACVTDISAVQFPAKDPSAGELAERISRSLPRAERALEASARARNVGFAAIAVAALALAVTIGVTVRRGGRSA